MSTDINFLSGSDAELQMRKKRVRFLNMIAVGSLVVVGLISLSIFLATQAVNLDSIKKDQASTIKKINQLGNRQYNLFVANNRIEKIDNILKVRKNLSKTMGSLMAKVPDQMTLDSFSVGDKEVMISGKSKSLAAIGVFINNLTDMARKKEIIKSLTLGSLSLVENGYQLSIKSEL